MRLGRMMRLLIAEAALPPCNFRRIMLPHE